ncbi:MAG: prepilin-type N-terminal cleavage/methylation domain-containing protein [Gammaproteobacteria bacterium]|nr:prepilin-type N-terminal cleavage/methylation domain-containing protein [Gammaproteobacteria bacterium]
MTPISGASPFIQRHRAERLHGFTLLELLVVLSIIVLATAIIIPNISATDNNMLIAQVRQTASAFNYTRRLAIVEAAPQVTTILQMSPDDPDYPDIKGEILQRANVPLLESFDVEITFQEDVNTEPEVMEIIEMVFYPQGGSTGGILNFTFGDLTSSIRVDPITGKIKLYYPGEEPEDDLF